MSSDNTVTQLRPNQNISRPSRHKSPDNAFSEYGSGGGGGSMNDRITRLESVYEQQQKTLAEIRDDLRGIRSDISGFERSSRTDKNELERRVIDKMEDNHKWVMSLIISSLIVPILIALLTK